MNTNVNKDPESKELKFILELLNSNSIEHRIIKKTPAVTKVAACISAETGVGPSIASGSQTCRGN